MKKNKTRLQKWFQDYRIIIRKEKDFKQQKNFRFNLIRVVLLFVVIFAICFAVSFYLIGFTKVNKMLPGYTDSQTQAEINKLYCQIDSINTILSNNTKYYRNIKDILEGNDSAIIEQVNEIEIQGNNYFDNYDDIIISQDSEFLADYEKQPDYQYETNSEIRSLSFYPPVKGVISSDINLGKKHYGTDIIPLKNEVVKSTLNGVVIFSGWTIETGNVIIISHLHNIISVYKHNSALLKKENDFVKAGEPIAIAGNSGELTTGPHLHFELWFDNHPVNSREFITF